MAVDLEVRSTKKARKSALDRDVAMPLAVTEYDRVVTRFKDFTVEQWAMSTDCPGWNVRAMAGHMLGMAQMVATLPELIRQQATSQRSAKKNGGVSIDSLTALQVAKNANLTAGELVENMRRVALRAVRGRRRVPAIILNRRMPEEQGVGGQLELWTFGYLFDVILTRDPFMHRSTLPRPPAFRCAQQPTMRVCSWMTSCASGQVAMTGSSAWSSRGRREVPGARVLVSAWRWMPSSSVASSQAGSQRRACSHSRVRFDR